MRPTKSTYALAVFTLGFLMVGMVSREAHARGNLRSILWEKSAANTDFEDSCVTRDQCLVIVIAPWCPHCDKSMGMIRALQAKAQSSQTFGLRIVISGDKMVALQNQARTLGNFTFVDPSDEVMRNGLFPGYPTWAVLDHDSNVIHVTAGTYDDPSKIDKLLTTLGLSPS